MYTVAYFMHGMSGKVDLTQYYVHVNLKKTFLDLVLFA